jgi:hypothetical protein
MYITKRLLFPVLVALVAAGSLMFALSATRAAAPNEAAGLLRSSLAPSLVSDSTFHGVAPGGADWALTEGSARLQANGRLQLAVDGLVLTSLGTAGPVDGIAASLFCDADSNTVPVSTTGVAPLTKSGDGSIDATLTLPSSCLAPIVLVHPQIGTNLITSRYIAVTGFRPEQ